MRPATIRSYLLLLNLVAFFPLLVTAAMSGAPLSAGTALTLCTFALAMLLSVRLANAIRDALAALPGGTANTRIREFAEASATVAAGLRSARAREHALREADSAKDAFYAVLSHELRNPLGALAAAAQVLQALTQRNPAAGEAAQVVTRQVEQMTRLVEDLLDVTRVTRGKVSLSRQPLDLAAVAERTVRELRACGRLEQHHVNLDLQPVCVRADEARVAQIVLNLVGNALKYTPAGGSIDVSLRRDRDTAVLRVHDSGVGMTPELAMRVFDAFVQGDGSLERRSGGLGIGLTLVKHLVELQGGRAFAASAGPGCGSVFTITLPASDLKPEPDPRAAQAGALQSHRILLIEDNADARRALADALSLAGHEVHTASDGRTGMDALDTLDPDVAVIDIGLPGLNGYQVAQAVRAMPRHEGVALIALTGYGQPDSQRRAREAGFDQFVTKPIAPQQLVRLMETALAGKKQSVAAH